MDVDTDLEKPSPLPQDTVEVPREQWDTMCAALAYASEFAAHSEDTRSLFTNDLEGAFSSMKDHRAKLGKGDRILSTLNEEIWVPEGAQPLIDANLSLIKNSTDEEYIKGWRHCTLDEQEERGKLRFQQAVKLASMQFRMRNFKVLPTVIIKESLERLFQGSSKADWARLAMDRSLVSYDWVMRGLAEVKNWVPDQRLITLRDGLVYNQTYSVSARDNLEFWIRFKYGARVVKGVRRETEVLHTVTGCNVPVRASVIVEDEVPDMDHWPFQCQWDMRSAVMTEAQINEFMSPIWAMAVQLHEDVGEDHLALLLRPPPEADNRPNREPTYHYNVPIIMNCGTASYADAKTIIAAVRRDNPHATKHLVWGDMQTVYRLWHCVAKEPDKYPDICPAAGEWHMGAHLVEAVVKLNWRFIYEPFVHFMGITGINEKCVMKEHDVRYRWTVLLLTAGLTWMKSIWTADEIASPKKLLYAVRNNTPVRNFIGFLFYHAAVVLAHKRAIQVDDPKRLNDLWKYSLFLYGSTNKTQYKKGVLMMCKVLYDAEPNIHAIMELHRTYTRGGPCRGAAFDHMVETVHLAVSNLFPVV